MTKPPKDSKRMWYTGHAFYVRGSIEYVAVREPETQRYPMSPSIEYHNGMFWLHEPLSNFHETKEAALEAFKVARKKRIDSLAREIASLANKEPKWKIR